MMLRPRRVALAGVLAATAALLALGATAQANTTIPGQNGKIAFTTNANVLTESALSDSATRGTKQCFFLAPGAENPFGFDALDCTAEIATINSDGTGLFQVTHNQQPDDKPAWLPTDGSKLAYQSVNFQTDCPEKALCGYNVYDTTPDGSSGHQLTTTDLPPSGLFNSSYPSYSPDGSRIAFETFNPIALSATARDTAEDPLFKQFNHLFSTIATMPAAGETPGPVSPLIPADEYTSGPDIVSDSQPTYSPDGTKIAFVRMTISLPETPGTADTRGIVSSVSSSIYTVAATGGTPTQVETGPDCNLQPQELTLVLSQVQTGSPLDSTRLPVSGPSCTFYAAPAWSPDGSKLAAEQITFPSEFLSLSRQGRGLTAGVFEDSDIVAFNSANGSGLTDLSDVTEPADCADFGTLKSGFSCGLEQKPAWSPDGTKIAFFSERNSDGVFPAEQCLAGQDLSVCDDEIWTMNADGSSPFQVTNNDVNDINPDWQRIPTQVPVTPATPVKPRIGVAGVRTACVSKAFHVRFRVSTTASTVKKVVVKLDGKTIKSTSKGSFTLSINSKRLKAGKHRLTIVATNAAGQTTTTHKSFSVCKAAKPRHKAGPRFTG